MSGNIFFNPAGYQQLQLRYSLALAAQTNPQILQQAAQLQQLFGQDALLRGGYGSQGFQTPGFPTSACGCMPSPNIQFSGAPAGRGLNVTTADQAKASGWPENSVTTAGGYHVVPNGGSKFTVFGPNDKPTDKPMMEVSGDPHLYTRDANGNMKHVGDFTHDSNLRLPDGTNIAMKTSSQTGQSVTTGLDITNGADRVQISGINGSPTVGQVTVDGYEARARLSNSQDTFHLGGTSKDVKLFYEHDNVIQGAVTGSTQDGQRTYTPTVDANQKYYVDPNLRPSPWTNPDAWGNQMRDEAVDIARRTGNQGYADQMGQLMFADHLSSLLNPYNFGGFGQWGGFPQQTLSVGNLFQMLQFQDMQSQLINSARYNTINV